ncbi:MAG: hypothetical protein ACKPKO_28125, partial [Candidatus Fonsibacter sp.]
VNGPVMPSSGSRLQINVKRIDKRLGCHRQTRASGIRPDIRASSSVHPEIPQSHQCGLIAQSVEQIDELRHAVVGGTVGEDGKESLRGLNYNAIFTYAVKAIQ